MQVFISNFSLKNVNQQFGLKKKKDVRSLRQRLGLEKATLIILTMAVKVNENM